MADKIREILCFVYGKQKESTKQVIINDALTQIKQLLHRKMPERTPFTMESNYSLEGEMQAIRMHTRNLTLDDVHKVIDEI